MAPCNKPLSLPGERAKRLVNEPSQGIPVRHFVSSTGFGLDERPEEFVGMFFRRITGKWDPFGHF